MTQTQITAQMDALWSVKPGTVWPEAEELMLQAGREGLALALPSQAAATGTSQGLAKLSSTQGWGLSSSARTSFFPFFKAHHYG